MSFSPEGQFQPAIYVLHENADWMEPLREALYKTEEPVYEWDFSPEKSDLGPIDLTKEPPLGVFYNRMSASSQYRGHRYSCEYTSAILGWLTAHGRPVLNGPQALALEVSKMAQWAAFQSVGIPTPYTIAAFGENQILEVAKKLERQGPFILKPNRSGSGIGVRLFSSAKEVSEYLQSGEFEMSVDGIMLLQQFIEAQHYYRLEFVGKQFLYALKVQTGQHPTRKNSFDFCPAAKIHPESNVQDPDEVEAESEFSSQFVVCPEFDHPIIPKILDLMRQRDIDVCAVEFIEAQDGTPLAFDLNTNTNYNKGAEERAKLRDAATGAGAIASSLRCELFTLRKRLPSKALAHLKKQPAIKDRRLAHKVEKLHRREAMMPSPFPAMRFAFNLLDKFQTESSAAKFMAFADYYQPQFLVRPDMPDVELITVTKNQRLTPDDYDRNVFHMEFDTSKTKHVRHYKMGDALAVYPLNRRELVSEFIDFYDLDPKQVISLDGVFELGEGVTALTTVERLLTQILDVFGRPTRRFYQLLYPFATDVEEKVALAEYTLDRKKDDFQKRVERGVTYFSILKEFPSARPPLRELAKMIPPIKSRLYSIASSSLMHPDSVHLLVVEETWDTADNEHRAGLCSNYLSELKVGDQVAASLTDSLMHLPKNQEEPIIMAGLGTGMAPFRAFIEEKAYWHRKGVKVGPVVLYFGSRYRSKEFLYGEELEAYEKEGLVTSLRLAFSRDQKHKVYIQHLMAQDGEMLNDYLCNRNGHFYLCGPTWPAEDVRQAIEGAFVQYGGMGSEGAGDKLKELKDQGHYILEVY